MRDIEAGFIGINPFDDSDFTGAASIFLTEADFATMKKLHPSLVDQSIITDFFISGFFDVDLIIENVSFQYADHQKLDEELGDTFSIHYHGKAPIMLGVSCRLFDLDSNAGKYAFFNMYRDIFRLSKVAKYKIVPNIEFVGCIASGAMLNLSINETSQTEDYVSINFQLLINGLYFSSTLNEGRVDYTSIVFDKSSALDKTLVNTFSWPSIG